MGERAAEEGGAGRDVVFQSRVVVLAVERGRRAPRHVHQETLFEQTLHVARRINLLDFHFRVDIALIQKVDVDFLDFRNAVLV